VAHKGITTADRSALFFRPKIGFVEPEFDGKMPEGRAPGRETPEEVEDKWDELDRIAKATSILAQALQIQIDQNSGDFYIGLDSNQDRHVIDAVGRRFPGADTDRVTYAQYRECRQGLAEKAQAFAGGVMPTQDQIKNLRKNPMNEKGALGFDLNSAEAKAGLLRPELVSENMPVEPLDLAEIQQNLLLSLIPESFGDEDESVEIPEI